MSRIKNAQLRYRVIDRCLRNKYNPFPSKEDLRQACEEALYGSTGGDDICDSTIEKDLFAMRMDFDAPIKYSKREKGYFYEDDEFSIDKIPLSADDVEAIKFASSTLMQFREVGIFKQFGFAIDKIFDRVHISDNPLDESVDSFVRFETVPASKGNEYLPELLRAIKSKFTVHFDYQSFRNDDTNVKSREVCPLLLKEYRNRWYLISFSLSKEKVITYALDRMKNVLVTEEVFNKSIDFDADKYFEHAIGITVNEQQPEKVVVKIDKVGSKYLETQPLHKSQVLVKEGKKRNTFELNVLVSEELKRTILSYGSQMEVIKPSWLRDEINTVILEMHEIYG